METLRLAAFVLIAMLQLPGAEKADDVATHGQLNGWAWIAMREMKAVPLDTAEMYVSGAISALDAFGSDVKLSRPHMTAAELSLAVDNFYTNPLNRPIPIVFAFMVIKLRIEGADSDVQEKAALVLRKDAAAKDTATKVVK